MNKGRVTAFLLAAGFLFSGCALLIESPDDGASPNNPAYQMAHHPVGCLLVHVMDSVANDNIQAFRDTYRWAGIEAGDDFARLRRMMLFSDMPFTLRMDPPVFELSGRGLLDLRNLEAMLSCNPAGKGAFREVKGIVVEGQGAKGKINLVANGGDYRILRIDWF